MTRANIKYMSDSAIDYLRANTKFASKMIVENPDNHEWLKDVISGEIFITKKYEIDDFELATPEGPKDIETDFNNSILLFEHLKSLPQYVLSDERFWAWINFEKGYKAAIRIAPVTENNSVFANLWLFTQGKRRGQFFGIMSRCFYRVALSIDDTLDDKYELSRFVVENPLRFREFTWRNYSSLSHVVLGTLKAEKKYLDTHQVKEKGYYYDELAKSLSKAGSVCLLDVMSEEDIERLAYEEFSRIVESA